jgi:hypothetical protein
MPESTEATTTERWVFGGLRVGGNHKRLHEWVAPGGERRLFAAAGSYAIGSIYEAKVTHGADGLIHLHGKPAYTGERCDDDELVGQLAARARAAETALSLVARERAAKRTDPVEAAIGQLAELASHVPAVQRQAFLVYVTTRLTKAAWK